MYLERMRTVRDEHLLKLNSKPGLLPHYGLYEFQGHENTPIAPTKAVTKENPPPFGRNAKRSNSKTQNPHQGKCYPRKEGMGSMNSLGRSASCGKIHPETKKTCI